MDTGGMDILSRHPVPRHRLTIADYHRMAGIGILGAADRVELIEGQLVAMSPIGVRHALAVDALMELLIGVAGRQAKIRVQNPIVLDDGTQPNPDVTLVRYPWRGHPDRHPGPEDVLLLVEVSDTSLMLDRDVKRELYARAGIGEYWIADLGRGVVHVHRQPAAGRYERVVIVEPSGMLEIEALAGVAIPAAPLFT